MPRDPCIALVGKPLSGKSTTLNSLTDANAKVGAFPFTTIEPNKATGYLQVECACGRLGLQERCKPNYGWCENGKRLVPIQLLDVAGLVPGALQGRGLGNKFLDDLRQNLDMIIHVMDVSGTTDENGKATRGYDPVRDVQWLQDEIRLWIETNLKKRWGSIVRRHTATKLTVADTLQTQFGGYGGNLKVTMRALARIKNLPKLEDWDDEWITRVVEAYMAERFPTVLLLNKIDHPDADKNISKIMLKYPETKCVLTSAITEVFLRKLDQQGFIKYDPGTEFVDTLEDLPDLGLKPLDEKLASRIENVRDLVLYRFGSTGVVQVLQACQEVLGLVPVFPVRSIAQLAPGGLGPVLRDCVLVKAGTPVAQVARQIVGEVTIAAIEGANGLRVGEDDVVEAGKNDILSFRIAPAAKE